MQLVSRMLSNEAYAWDGDYDVSRSYVPNILNQYNSAGSVTFTYDLHGT